MKEIHTLELVEGEPTKSFERTIQQAMEKDISHFRHEIDKLRTGRAHPAMVEDLIVSCYGTAMKLKEVASISTPEPQSLVIQPWDKNLINDIEKAITASDIGINPINDGAIIRLTMPHMTSDRRKELVKMLHKKLEESRIGLRNIRESVRKIIKDAEKSKKISEDFARRLNDLLQKITDEHIQKVEHISMKKESEILHI